MKRSGFIDSVRVGSPCSEDWDEMVGNERVRFCSHCAKSVNNLSEMTRKEASRLVRRSKGNLCIRYIKDPKTSGPIFSEQLVQIARRTSRMAAGVISASLTLSTLAIAQGGVGAGRSGMRTTRSEPTESKSDIGDERAKRAESFEPEGSVTGTVLDPNGALIPGAAVTLTDKNGNGLQTVATDDSGMYEFLGVPDGIYSISITVAGFKNLVYENLSAAGKTKVTDSTLEVSEMVVTVGGAMSIVEFEGALASAVAQDDVELVKELLARGENVNKKEEDKTTPLFVAVENGNIEITRLLLDAGAKVNVRDSRKQTPLMQLDDETTRDLVELLLRSGAKVDLADKDGTTALMIAAEESSADVVQALIDAGAAIDAKNEEGQTALMNAAFADNLEKVKALVLAGADVNLKNKDGETAWDQTAEDEIEAFLVGHGAEVPPQEPDGESTIEEPSDGEIEIRYRLDRFQAL